MAFQQDLRTNPIVHFVFPICRLVDENLVLEGTGFFIGNQGRAITAAHVAEHIAKEGNAFALFPQKGKWEAVPIVEADWHPTEDVGILDLMGSHSSILLLNFSRQPASFEYELWGYPETVAHEGRKLATDEKGLSAVKPDLIYNRGYFRRRIDHALPAHIYRGEHFYEMSQVAGACCSGAPIVSRVAREKRQAWEVVGVYIGEETSSAVGAVGYATRLDTVADWVPDLLGHRLADER